MSKIFITTQHSMRTDSHKTLQRKVVNNTIKLDKKVYHVSPSTFNNKVVKGEYNLTIGY